MTDEHAIKLMQENGWTVKRGEDRTYHVSFTDADGTTLVPEVIVPTPIGAMLGPTLELRIGENTKRKEPYVTLRKVFDSEIRRELAEARITEREDTLQWMDRLRSVMLMNPDLPVEIVGAIGIGSAISWMEGYQRCDVCSPTIETVAIGRKGHMIIKDKNEPDGYDPAPDELDWYKAIVVRVC